MGNENYLSVPGLGSGEILYRCDVEAHCIKVFIFCEIGKMFICLVLNTTKVKADVFVDSGF